MQYLLSWLLLSKMESLIIQLYPFQGQEEDNYFIYCSFTSEYLWIVDHSYQRQTFSSLLDQLQQQYSS